MKIVNDGQFALGIDTNTSRIFLMRHTKNEWEKLQELTVEFANLLPKKVPNGCVWEFTASGKNYAVTCEEQP